MRAALLLALALASCTAVSKPASASPHSLGFVTWTCGQKPTAWVRMDVLGTRYEQAVRAHESSHIREMQALGCKAWREKLTTDREYRIRFEAKGFCASARSDVAQGHAESLRGAIRFYSGWLSSAYPFKLSPADAEAAITAECG